MHLTKREIATVIEALGFWEEWLFDLGNDVRDFHSSFQTESPLASVEIEELISRLQAASSLTACSFGEANPTWMFPFKIPTYLGHQDAISDFSPDRTEFTEANVPVLISPAEGIRVVLGTHDYHDHTKPDIQIERRPHGWAIFLHPDAGDPVGTICILDDRRTFFVPEIYVHDPLQVVEDYPPELDFP